mmetsp:Transcript_95475/g.275671  ORF Transcript_95475/g.275671 Transcript_95475/m.275671 type:complete len:215 (+) Transcript_95475:75-719(+)
MIPIMSPMSGSILTLPEEVRRKLTSIKWCVFGLWFFGGLFFIIQPFSALSTIALAIFGTFFLSEDPQLANCYTFLRESVVGPCCGNGGMAMLTPFLFFSVFNSLLDGLQLVQIFSRFGQTALTIWPVYILVGIWVCETSAALLSWKVLKAVAPSWPEPAGGSGYQPLPAGGPGMGVGGQPLGGRPRPPRQIGMPSSSGGGEFQPFAGQGHRLGG